MKIWDDVPPYFIGPKEGCKCGPHAKPTALIGETALWHDGIQTWHHLRKKNRISHKFHYHSSIIKTFLYKYNTNYVTFFSMIFIDGDIIELS